MQSAQRQGGQQQGQQSGRGSSNSTEVKQEIKQEVDDKSTVKMEAGTKPSAQQVMMNRESKLVSTCRMGQEMVHEIVIRTQEVFSYLKMIHPVVGAPIQDQQCVEKHQRMMDVLKAISLLMSKLKVCKDLVRDPDQNSDFDVTKCIPFRDEDEETRLSREKPFQSESYQKALAEHNELVMQLTIRNKHLKDIIDQMRNIIWEINTMLDMRQRQG